MTPTQITAELQAIDAEIAQLESQLGLSVPPAQVLGASTSTVILNITANPALTAQTITPGSANQRVASFLITNTSNAPITLSNVNSIEINPGANSDVYMGIRVYVNGGLYGSQAGITNNALYPIAGASPITIAANGQATIDVYADVSATAPLNTENTAAIYLSIPNAVSSATVYGQQMTIGSVAGTSASTSGAVISSISPTSGGTGTQVVITASGFTSTSTVSVFLNNMLAAQSATMRNGSTISFVVPISATGNCVAAGSSSSTVVCSGQTLLLAPTTYQLSIEVNGAMSNAVPFQLTANPYYNPL